MLSCRFLSAKKNTYSRFKFFHETSFMIQFFFNNEKEEEEEGDTFFGNFDLKKKLLQSHCQNLTIWIIKN